MKIFHYLLITCLDAVYESLQLDINNYLRNHTYELNETYRIVFS